MKKFKSGDNVEILGTDGVKAYLTLTQPSNTDLYLVSLNTGDTRAVYPYYGYFRLYPEYMLTLCNESAN